MDMGPASHPIRGEVPDVSQAMANFDAISYQKGQSVLKQLSAYVGEEAFLAGLQAYFRDHAWGNTRLEDLTARHRRRRRRGPVRLGVRLAGPRRHRHPRASRAARWSPPGPTVPHRARTASTSAATPTTVTAGCATSATSPSAPTASRRR